MADEVIYENLGNHVRLLTMNRPETLNALTPDGNRLMRHRVGEFNDDEDAWVLIITGAGDRSFSTGLDLRAQAAENAAGPRKPAAQVPQGGSIHSYPSLEVWKPIIAAINGYAFGGGLEIALWGDIRIASENAELGMLEPRRGLLSISLVTRLVRTIPQAWAMEMMLTARRYSAEECLRRGLVNAVVPQDQLLDTAKSWANEIATECAPLSTRMIKEFVARTAHLPERDALQFQSLFSQRLRAIAPEDSTEGPRAFAEKRKAIWKAQ